MDDFLAIVNWLVFLGDAWVKSNQMLATFMEKYVNLKQTHFP